MELVLSVAIGKAHVMATLLILICLMAGALLGLRCNVFILVPVSLLVAVVTVVGGIVSGHAIGLVALVTYGTLASLQIGYVAGCMLLEYFPVRATRRFSPPSLSTSR
jgi:hypothetical protein